MVALAGLARIGCVFRRVELETQGLFEHHVVNPLKSTRVARIEIFRRIIQPLVEVIVWGKDMMERHEILCKRIEWGRDSEWENCRDCVGTGQWSRRNARSGDCRRSRESRRT